MGNRRLPPARSGRSTLRTKNIPVDKFEKFRARNILRIPIPFFTRILILMNDLSPTFKGNYLEKSFLRLSVLPLETSVHSPVIGADLSPFYIVQGGILTYLCQSLCEPPFFQHRYLGKYSVLEVQIFGVELHQFVVLPKLVTQENDSRYYSYVSEYRESLTKIELLQFFSLKLCIAVHING